MRSNKNCIVNLSSRLEKLIGSQQNEGVVHLLGFEAENSNFARDTHKSYDYTTILFGSSKHQSRSQGIPSITFVAEDFDQIFVVPLKELPKAHLLEDIIVIASENI